MLTKNRFILAKREATYGSDPTPTPALNAIEALNCQVNYQGDLKERDVMRNNISSLAPVVGKRWVEVSFDVEVKGGGTKGTASRIGDLLVACGFSEVASAGSSVTYSPASQGHSSVCMYIYDQLSSASAVLHKITGARGSFSIKLDAGAIGLMSFNFKGLYNAPADVADPVDPTYETTIPPIVESSQFTINSISSLIVQSVNIDINNELVEQEDINSVASLKGFLITGRKPSGSFNPEAVSIATYPFVADFISASQRALSIVLGSAPGNKLTITAPKVTLDGVTDSDRNGIKTVDNAFRCNLNAGNDEVVLKYE